MTGSFSSCEINVSTCKQARSGSTAAKQAQKFVVFPKAKLLRSGFFKSPPAVNAFACNSDELTEDKILGL